MLGLAREVFGEIRRRKAQKEISKLMDAANAALEADDRDRYLLCSREISELAPERIDVRERIAAECLRREDLAGAERECQAILRINPDNLGAHLRLGAISRRAGSVDVAILRFRQALAIDPQNVTAMKGLIAGFRSRGDHRQAWYYIEQAIDISPEDPGLAAQAANLALLEDDHAKALRYLEPHLEAQETNPEILVQFLRCARKNGRFEEALERAEPLLEGARQGVPQSYGDRVVAVNICFNVARELEREKRHDEAFDLYELGNHYRALYQGEDKGFLSRFEPLAREFFTPERIASLPDSGSTAEPIFVVGTPRSGTTLLEQMLSRHPEIANCGELTFVNRAYSQIAGTGAGNLESLTNVSPQALATLAERGVNEMRYYAGINKGSAVAHYVDKLPGNFFIMPLLFMLYPRARVLHIRRDPRDACLSMYCQNFSNGHLYSNRLDTLARFYGAYERLTTHYEQLLGDRVQVLRYEDLVSAPEASLKALCAYIGVAYDSACLNPQEGAGFVATASTEQVREPINRSAIGKWQRYEHRLQPLLEGLRAEGVIS